MKVLIIDFNCNAIDVARRFVTEATEQGHDNVWVVILSNSIDATLWAHPGISINNEIRDHQQLITYIQDEEFELVINFNALVAYHGLAEALSSLKIPYIGANKKLANTEINKRYFKQQLINGGFSTPKVQLEGMANDILDSQHALNFPLVIKPDIQMGPKVAICKTRAELEHYLEHTAKKIPESQFATVYSIEEFIPCNEVMAVQYHLCAGQGFITDSVRMTFSSKSSKNVDGSLSVCAPHPWLETYRETIEQLLTELAQLDCNAIGNIQCLFDSAGKLFFIENNCRPAAYSFLERDNVYAMFMALKNNDALALSACWKPLWTNTRQARIIPLLHDVDQLEVNFQSLNHLSWAHYFPFSVRQEQDKYVSRHRETPSLLLVQGSSQHEIKDTLAKNFDGLDWVLGPCS